MRIQKQFYLFFLTFLLPLLTHSQDLVLKSYEGYNLVGNGSFGRVFDINGQAVKVSHCDFDNPNWTSNLKEASLLSILDHPNIIKPQKINFKHINNETFLEIHMPLGQAIATLDVKQIFQGLGEAIGYLHELNLAHMDLKPSNFISIAQEPILIDLGAAEIFCASPIDQNLTTLWYRSPESLNKNFRFPKKLDSWSFAASIYELGLKQPLAAGNNRHDVAKKITTKTESQPSTLGLEIFL